MREDISQRITQTKNVGLASDDTGHYWYYLNLSNSEVDLNYMQDVGCGSTVYLV